MKSIDLLIKPRWVIPIVPKGYLDNHAIAIDNGLIIELLPWAESTSKYNPGEVVALDDHVVMPGLVNAHTHAGMTLFRGIADDLPLDIWLQEHIWPAENRWVSKEFVRAGTDLAIAEMLLSGTTCFNDMYFFPDVVADSVDRSGIRGSICQITLDFPTVWAKEGDEYLEKGLALHRATQDHPRITTTLAPHAPYTVSDALFEKTLRQAVELDLPIHLHLHETAREVEESIKIHGIRPIERMERLGIINQRLIAIHMTQLTRGEIDLFSEREAHIVHCAESNLKLASGFCPVNQLIESNVSIALGTDSTASNNDLDMIGEIKTAALLAKGVSSSPSALPAEEALEAATLGGASALGLDHRIGSIERGKAADLIALNLSSPSTQPLYNPLSQVVYSATRSDVSDLWVSGEQLLENHRLTTLEEDKVLQDANQWGKKITKSSL